MNLLASSFSGHPMRRFCLAVCFVEHIRERRETKGRWCPIMWKPLLENYQRLEVGWQTATYPNMSPFFPNSTMKTKVRAKEMRLCTRGPLNKGIVKKNWRKITQREKNPVSFELNDCFIEILKDRKVYSGLTSYYFFNVRHYDLSSFPLTNEHLNKTFLCFFLQSIQTS
jgi:hypothetical protein